MNKKLSIEQRIHNAQASQEVENVKAWHTYLHGKANSTEEWRDFWSKSDDCSWAHAFGRMRGFESVWYGSVTRYDAHCCENYLKLYDAYPEVGGKDVRPLMECSVHTLLTDVIEVADDGMTARASFITPGVIHSTLNPDKRRQCGFLWERYGSDFIYEDGSWKYLHEQVCPDIFGRMDAGNWAADGYQRLKNPPPPREGGDLPPNSPPVQDPGPLHNDYTPIQPPQDTVPWPEPYATMDNDNTYTKRV